MCTNRIVQNGSKLDLEIFDTLMKGKGVRTRQFIPAGSFVTEYLGEIIGTREHAESLIQQRTLLKEPNFIMFLREFYLHNNLTQITIIDAKNYSNIARFINHGCEPNLCVIPVRIDNMIPHAALFALNDIDTMQELCYDYNGSVDNDLVTKLVQEIDKKDENLLPCYCGSNKCNKYLPTNLSLNNKQNIFLY